MPPPSSDSPQAEEERQWPRPCGCRAELAGFEVHLVGRYRVVGCEDLVGQHIGLLIGPPASDPHIFRPKGAEKITVDEGASMWRIRPRAQGRASWIQKRTSHIKVVLSER